MGANQSGLGGGPPGQGGDNKDKKDPKKDKPKYEPPPQPTTRIGRKKRKQAGPNAAAKLPNVYPTARCKLRYLRMQRIHDHLLLEEEYVENQERLRKARAATSQQPSATADSDALDRNADERSRVDDMRGSPMGVGNLEELIDDDHAIVSSATGPEYYVSIMSFVDKDLLEPGASVLLHHKSVSVVGVLTDDADPLVSVMKLDKAPTESYADIGGLEQQIQEVREAVELPLLHPELYEEMGIKPPKGVILYGAPGTGKTLLAKAVANQTSATFLRIVGSELIQKYLGDGPRLVRQLFQVAAEHAPSIVFIDEIDAVGTKRYDSTSGGEREIQRTMLELLNQLDGFDDRGDVKVIMATNKIDTLDPALIRPGRIDRKILFENPDQNTKRKIFTLHTSKMSLADDVDLEEFINQKDDLSGADIRAMCSEAGLMALRERRMRVNMADFRQARESIAKVHGAEMQSHEQIAYLGPKASYTHQTTIEDVFSQVQSGKAEFGVVPFENSTNGSVVFTLDLFADQSAKHPDIVVCGERYVDVHHCLLGHPAVSGQGHATAPTKALQEGTKSPSSSGHATPIPGNPNPSNSRAAPLTSLSHIKKLYSHPQAWGQCKTFLSCYLKGVERQDVSSTSRAAELVAADETNTTAAISSGIAAQMTGLDFLARDIEDEKDNATRFFIIRRRSLEDTSPASDKENSQLHTQAYKSLLSFTVSHTDAGALADALAVFKARGINLTSINPRPSGEAPWHYMFFVEFSGRRGQAAVDDTLTGLDKVVRSWRWLGSWENALQQKQ
ncbi:26S protease regulatory subunit 4 [Aureobasidium sp. EXF-12298]|nr:26S protease regulatory subunit 4 [Aureobasidium sp. EXF-12298]KAI4759329.1 26S protease regulatory subunit 4 [Aureobasidium sp. EXF-12344]KAI4783052.1 26S protease regulatory subunit 4 [Aureobasidium sp. EXF-3400]